MPVIGGWTGYASGSPSAGVLTFYLMGIVYCLAVPGRARSRAKPAGKEAAPVFRHHSYVATAREPKPPVAP